MIYMLCYEAVSYDIIENGITVGYAVVMVDGRSAYCERIDIDEPYRNHRYSTAALEDLSRMYGSIIVARITRTHSGSMSGSVTNSLTICMIRDS